ncbi:hypothetical protein PoB_004556500 [Plakobranchus ocellatus]|uniref:Uncharacterized protein n=1 Tax=Plakobranchus ocellatus TaxID=259542 RepID=A0AAV4BEP4_9GAST|nr:hypothetical protein PoB_004556500 [Plakobranchus ocellatus]
MSQLCFRLHCITVVYRSGSSSGRAVGYQLIPPSSCLLARVNSSPCSESCLETCSLLADENSAALTPLAASHLDICNQACSTPCGCVQGKCDKVCAPTSAACYTTPSHAFNQYYLALNCQLLFLTCHSVCGVHCTLTGTVTLLQMIIGALVEQILALTVTSI